MIYFRVVWMVIGLFLEKFDCIVRIFTLHEADGDIRAVFYLFGGDLPGLPVLSNGLFVFFLQEEALG